MPGEKETYEANKMRYNSNKKDKNRVKAINQPGFHSRVMVQWLSEEIQVDRFWYKINKFSQAWNINAASIRSGDWLCEPKFCSSVTPTNF